MNENDGLTSREDILSGPFKGMLAVPVFVDGDSDKAIAPAFSGHGAS